MDSLPPPETMCEGRYLRLVRRGRWEYAERTNAGCAVIVIAVTPEDKVVFVEQYRIPIAAPTIEMPAGLVGDVDADDTLEAAAKRELLEETGWSAERVEVLMSGPTSSGMSNETVAFVRAHGLTRMSAGGGDETEDIIVHEVPRAEAAAWLCRKMTEGYALDPKLWTGLWFIDHNPDGSRARSE
ncbi:NUDIX hydrolase [Rehaibacterium terrae]|jgi:ADP-ribose pyrophosphatase|uniref:GDP-mannose pyrophosphatase n=1 Tax=Rehaibacterium terrae TaxID=1341696 RepID=A0A7W8DFI3_9GAMM|nr:NUDIX hydrolase [Rehaibacterium terrae]MBB5016547.1 ADP-ribose pyrophosphatase [Rehaibacterium terrae]